ncbi:transcription factor IIIB 60 kDa subunit-like [Lotus japonicus]|uniref:transcription factor IIIB 60 kDa subunit-like n=1 Tax=Lotus japonicus TaxID=34305 RepID=UPI002584CA2A|nr:transcription factor IIIB 60 kDa subunit-like [Lotus japonicus]
MVFCSHCLKNVPGDRTPDKKLCCRLCGKVLEEFYYSDDPGFTKDSSGQSRISGQCVSSIQSEFSASRQRTLDNAHAYIKAMSCSLGVDDENMFNQALAFYRIGLERNFTKGRRSELVQASCLYIAFRQNNKPYLLIDFSNYLRTNVYVLGAVFLQLCKLLSLEEHPIVQKPVDPSLFIFKYTTSLLNHRNVCVTQTALNIIASMKRDWMTTGRKPGGLCGAALYVAALANGWKKSKSEIQRIVHVCEATLTKRLVEFENTESASLTVEELNTMAKELENNPAPVKIPNGEGEGSKDLLCEHKASGKVPYFALGLCETCYKDFEKLSGGLSGGLDPPAFQRSAKLHSEESAKKSNEDLVKATNEASCESRLDKNLHASQPESINCEHDESHREDDMNAKTDDEESESLSDIDDLEVNGYLHSEQEKHFKKIIWEKMNREYLEEQAVKEAAAAAAKKAFEANFENCSEDLLAAREFAESTAASVAKSRKEMKKRRAEEAKSLGPPQSAAEATKQMLRTKRLSNKVNYDLLQSLFDEPVAPENPKKVRFEIPSDDQDNLKSKFGDKIQDDELGSVDEFEDDDMHGDYYGNADEAYDYEDDGYSFDY